MALTAKERARIEAAINELKTILSDDEKPKTYAKQNEGILSPLVEVGKDWEEIDSLMAQLSLTWESPRITTYLEACAKRIGKPADKKYLSADAIATLKAKLKEAIA